jgi:cell division protein FtsQ
VAAAVILLLAATLYFVRIRTVTVTGNERYTDEQIEELLFPDNISRIPLLCYLKSRFRPHVKIPFVEDYKIAFQDPTSVDIIIYEKSVVGYVSYMSSYMYFDKDGIIVESDNEKLPGVPWITGLDFGQIVLYQPLPVSREDIFQEILNLTQILSIYNLKVDRIQYDSLEEATLYMDDLEILLGSNESLNGKIAELNDMLPMLEGRKGTLHLEEYQENGNTAGYAFKPAK